MGKQQPLSAASVQQLLTGLVTPAATRTAGLTTSAPCAALAAPAPQVDVGTGFGGPTVVGVNTGGDYLRPIGVGVGNGNTAAFPINVVSNVSAASGRARLCIGAAHEPLNPGSL